VYTFIRNRKQRKTIETLFKLVKSDLKNKVGTLTGLSQSDILQKYLQMEKGDDGLARNENTFNQKVWP
jgi:hypothetical protein